MVEKKKKIKSLKAIRLHLKMTKPQMADYLNIYRQLYNYTERAAQGYGPRVMIKLCELLGSDKKFMDFVRKYDR